MATDAERFVRSLAESWTGFGGGEKLAEVLAELDQLRAELAELRDEYNARLAAAAGESMRRGAQIADLQDQLAELRATHSAALAAHEAWLARVTQERDEAREEADTERAARFAAEEDLRVTRRELDEYYLAPVFAERDEARTAAANAEAELARVTEQRDELQASLEDSVPDPLRHEIRRILEGRRITTPAETRTLIADVLATVGRHTGALLGSATPTPPADPGYQRIADAIQQRVLDPGLYTLDIRQDGQPVGLYQLARSLDKAGLIDWAAIGDDPTPPAVAELRNEDLRRERYQAPDQPVNEGPRGVELVHIPTGERTRCHDYRTQLQNTAHALRVLTYLVHDKSGANRWSEALLRHEVRSPTPPATGHMVAPGVPCHGCQMCLIPDCPCAVGAFCSDHDPTEDGRTHCGCGRALPCRHCPEETACTP